MALRRTAADGLIRLASLLAGEPTEVESLRALALQDPLTQLPNRVAITQRLEAAQARQRRSGALYALLYIDLDNFKPVNDRYGHRTGDQVLRELARRMQDCVRGSDTPARIGGDEFVVCLEDLGFDIEAARNLAVFAVRRVSRALSEPVVVNDNTITVGASIGIVVPGAPTEPDAVLDLGDHAMYDAKGTDEGYVFAPQ